VNFLGHLMKSRYLSKYCGVFFSPQATESGGDLKWTKEERVMKSGYLSK